MAIRGFKVRPCVLRSLNPPPRGARNAADAARRGRRRHHRGRICRSRNRCPAWASRDYQCRYTSLLISMLRHLGRRRRDNPHSALILLCRGGARVRPCDYLTPAVPSGIADTPCPSPHGPTAMRSFAQSQRGCGIGPRLAMCHTRSEPGPAAYRRALPPYDAGFDGTPDAPKHGFAGLRTIAAPCRGDAMRPAGRRGCGAASQRQCSIPA